MTNIPWNIFRTTHLSYQHSTPNSSPLTSQSPLIPLCRCSIPTGNSSGGGSLFLWRVHERIVHEAPIVCNERWDEEGRRWPRPAVHSSPSLLFEVRWFENDPDVFVRGDLGGVRDGGINQGDTVGAARTAAVAADASPVGH